MKSIKIRWDTLDMEDKILTGVATFFEGDDPLHMKPAHTFKVSKLSLIHISEPTRPY